MPNHVISFSSGFTATRNVKPTITTGTGSKPVKEWYVWVILMVRLSDTWYVWVVLKNKWPKKEILVIQYINTYPFKWRQDQLSLMLILKPKNTRKGGWWWPEQISFSVDFHIENVSTNCLNSISRRYISVAKPRSWHLLVYNNQFWSDLNDWKMYQF